MRPSRMRRFGVSPGWVRRLGPVTITMTIIMISMTSMTSMPIFVASMTIIVITIIPTVPSLDESGSRECNTTFSPGRSRCRKDTAHAQGGGQEQGRVDPHCVPSERVISRACGVYVTIGKLMSRTRLEQSKTLEKRPWLQRLLLESLTQARRECRDYSGVGQAGCSLSGEDLAGRDLEGLGNANASLGRLQHAVNPVRQRSFHLCYRRDWILPWQGPIVVDLAGNFSMSGHGTSNEWSILSPSARLERDSALEAGPDRSGSSRSMIRFDTWPGNAQVRRKQVGWLDAIHEPPLVVFRTGQYLYGVFSQCWI